MNSNRIDQSAIASDIHQNQCRILLRYQPISKILPSLERNPSTGLTTKGEKKQVDSHYSSDKLQEKNSVMSLKQIITKQRVQTRVSETKNDIHERIEEQSNMPYKATSIYRELTNINSNTDSQYSEEIYTIKTKASTNLYANGEKLIFQKTWIKQRTTSH